MLDYRAQRDLPTILLIDDDPISREVMATVLTMGGYTVHTAIDGSSALQMLVDEVCIPGIILMDAQMPRPRRRPAHQANPRPLQRQPLCHQRQQPTKTDRRRHRRFPAQALHPRRPAQPPGKAPAVSRQIPHQKIQELAPSPHHFIAEVGIRGPQRQVFVAGVVRYPTPGNRSRNPRPAPRNDV